MKTAKAKSDAAKELAQLDRDVVDKRREEREVNLEHGTALRKVNQLQEHLTEDYARGRPIDKGKANLAEARRALKEDWPPRVEGARRAKERAVEARARFIGGHFGELATELLPDAEAAAEAVQDAIDALQIAKQRWEATKTRFETLMRDVPGVRGLAEPFPSLRLGGLEELLARVDGEVPLPVPRIPKELLPDGTPPVLWLERGADEDEEDLEEAV